MDQRCTKPPPLGTAVAIVGLFSGARGTQPTEWVLESRIGRHVGIKALPRGDSRSRDSRLLRSSLSRS